MLGVVVSQADEASTHIGKRLRALASWTAHEDANRSEAAGGGTYFRAPGLELREFADLHLHLEGVATAFDDPDILVFASRHSGDTGPLLTAHTPGNFGSADFGGTPHSLAEPAPNALTVVREAFDVHAPQGYETGIECTHHGPSTVGCPSLFVELGSTDSEWTDPAGATAVAHAILALRDTDPCHQRTVLGIGGGHYAPRYDRIITETDWRVGHIAADWALTDLEDTTTARAVITSAFQQSGTEYVVFDGEYPAIESCIDDLGYHVVTETWLRETSGVPLDLVASLEDDLASIDKGLRFGKPATGHDLDDVVITDIPLELLDEANGVDRTAVQTEFKQTAVAYETGDGGSLVTGQIALPNPSTYPRIIRRLASILESKYDTVTIESDAVIARREAFDPALARDAGVEEGPAFGRLAQGESIEVDGQTIHPADVRTAREHRFPF